MPAHINAAKVEGSNFLTVVIVVSLRFVVINSFVGLRVGRISAVAIDLYQVLAAATSSDTALLVLGYSADGSARLDVTLLRESCVPVHG